MVAVGHTNGANKGPVTLEQQPVDESQMVDGAKNPEKFQTR